MKVSLNAIRFMNQRYGTAGEVVPAGGVNQLVEKIGAQLGAVEEVIDVGKKYKGIVIAKVVSCESHPDADKLSLCRIDDGRKVKGVKRGPRGLIQVVCGAPNVKEGMLAVWLPPGTIVPATADKDPLKLEAREIRGQVSNGMLASSHELGLSEDHSGILDVDQSVRPIKPGTSFAEVYELENDVVIDIENKMFTHRPDLFGFLGISRELAGIQQKPFISPEWYKENPIFPAIEGQRLELKVQNELPKLAPRFNAVAMSDVKVGPSPIWLQVELSRVGIRPINNIVDYTNFFMMETAQPLHAYDYDKVTAKDAGAKHATITIRHPKKGETITLLGGKEVKPHPEAIMIASKTKAIGIGGVMGGADTEVDATTTNIILEAANFDMYSIRKTAMEHGLFTDAVTRFTKGQSPLQTVTVLAKIVDEIRKFAGGKVASNLRDSKHRLQNPEPVKVTAKFINERLGLNLTPAKMARLLENVEFKVMRLAGGSLGVMPPFWRTDIHIPEDVVEEIGRLYGYDHLPLDLPKRDLTSVEPEPMLEFKAGLREVLSAAGANEVLTYSFVPGQLMKKAGQNPANAFKIANALSPELEYYRMSLVPSLLDKIHLNIKSGFNEFALFEINQTHAKDLIEKDGLPIEEYRLGLVFAAEAKRAKYKYQGAAYYQVKKYLELLLSHLNIEAVYEPMTLREPKMEVGKAAAAPFERQRSAYVMTKDNKLIGEIGEFKPSVTSKFKLPAFTAGFEIDVAQLLKQQSPQSSYQPIPKFPKVEQDISLKVPGRVDYAQLHSVITKNVDKFKPSNPQFSLNGVDIYQDEEDKTHKHITFHLEIASFDRTLTAEEVNKLLDKAAAEANKKLGAERL